MSVDAQYARNWLGRHVHPLYGLVSAVESLSTFPGYPRLHWALAKPSNPNYLRMPLNTTVTEVPAISGISVSDRWETAAFVACVEAIERSAGFLWYRDELIRASGSEMAESAELVEASILWAPRRGGRETTESRRQTHQSFSRENVFHWAEVRDVATRDSYFLPAQMLWFLDPFALDGTRLLSITSNGMSAGRDLVDAILRGTYEIIERDAFIGNWLIGNAPSRIHTSLRDLPGIADEILSFFDSGGPDVSFFLLRNEFSIPVILCFIEDCELNLFGIGASARLDWTAAASKAFSEAYLTLLHQTNAFIQNTPAKKASDITDFLDHLGYYRDKKDKLSAFFGSGDALDPCELAAQKGPACLRAEDELGELTRRLGGHGYQVLYRDLTRADALDAGIHVARVVVPGLQPLYLGKDVPRDTRRLSQLATALGTKAKRPLDVIHPFP